MDYPKFGFAYLYCICALKDGAAYACIVNPECTTMRARVVTSTLLLYFTPCNTMTLEAGVRIV